MNEQQAALVKVLRELNAKTPDPDLEKMARALQITGDFSAFSDLPRAQDAGQRTARRELNTLWRKTDDLARLMFNLHSDALRAFEKVESRGDIHPLMLGPLLKVCALVAKQAIKEVPEAPPHRGNRPRVQPREVTRLAATIYTQLTEKCASRVTDAYRDGQPSGPFHAFLSNVFAVLNIQTSADSQAKLLQSSTRGKNTRKEIV